MNRDRIEGLLKQVTGTLNEQWGLLTDDRLRVVAGKCEQLAGLAQARRGAQNERSQRELLQFLQRHRRWNTSSHQ